MDQAWIWPRITPPLHPGYVCLLPSLFKIGTLVGWVERSETHHFSVGQLMGFAAINASYGLPKIGG
jgi:hypothetical protein